MPFDLSTAKPVTPSSGFDLNTAKPVEADQETIYRTETDKALSATPGLAGPEFEYLDNVQNRQKPAADHVGFTDIGKTTLDMLEYPAALFKGFGYAGVNAYATLDAGTLRQMGETKREVFENKPFDQMTDAEKVDHIARANTPPLATLMFGSQRDKALTFGWISRLLKSKEEGLKEADALIEASKKSQESAKQFVESANFVREDGVKGFIFDVGSIGTTIGSSIGLSVATKNPVAAAALFRDLQKNSVYLEAKDKGWENVDADKISTLAGNFEGGLEFIGVHSFLKAAEMSKPLSRIAFRSFEEAVQEMSQQASEETITQLQGLREQDLEGAVKRTFYAGLLGSIGGGGASIVTEMVERKAAQEGLPPPVAKKMAEHIMQSQPEIESHLDQIVKDEFSPLREDAEATAKVQKMYQDFVAGNEIDIADLTLEEQGMMEAIDRLNAAVPVTAADLKQARATGENEYMMSPQSIEEPDAYHGFHEMAQTLEPRTNGEFQVHGMMAGNPDENLINLIENGIDQSRGFNSGPPQGGLYGVDSSRTKAPYIILSDQNKSIEETGVKNVVAVGPAEANIPALRSAYPRINFMTVPEAQAFMNSGGTVKPELPPLKMPETKPGMGHNKPPPGGGGGDGTGSDGVDPERDYAAVAAKEEKSTFIEDTGGLLKDVHQIGADAFVPVSTRLGKINERLKHAVRKFVFRTNLRTHEDRQKIQPFVEKVSNTMSAPDYRIFDLALKNRDMAKVEELTKKYGIEQEYKAVREVLDTIHAAAQDVGMDVGYVLDYFPRRVKAGKAGEYMAFMRGQETWSDIKQAMEKEDPNGTMTDEEQAEFVNAYLRGFEDSKLKMKKPDNTKARTVDYIDAEMNEFYEDSMPTLLQYIPGMRHAIESRKLFGLSETETDNNIGAYVLNLVDQGIIAPEQEVELRKLLKAVVNPTGTRGAVTWAKNATYIYLMGSPISAITQVQDLAFSLHHNGYFRTSVSLLKSLTGNAAMTKEDIGLDNILHEFEDNSRSGEAVRRVFKAVGLSFMDNVGKQTYMDAALSRLQRAAAKDSEKFNEKMQVIFGEEADQVKADLQSGTMSENVKYLIFSELSDVQPISLAEMPVYYLNSGNGRIAYMLKTYTIRQIDLYRREIFAKLGRTSVEENIEGMKNLISLTTALMLTGMGADAIKDLLLGRDFDLSDLVMDNLVKLMGFTKYQIYKAKDDGIANTFFMTMVVPPVGAPIDDLGKDVAKIGFGDKELKDAEVLQRVPVVGKFYYWWFGGGRAKEEKRADDGGEGGF